MNLEDSIVSTISDARPMMILALCTIVLFVIVASLIEAWLAKARGPVSLSRRLFSDACEKAW